MDQQPSEPQPPGLPQPPAAGAPPPVGPAAPAAPAAPVIAPPVVPPPVVPPPVVPPPAAGVAPAYWQGGAEPTGPAPGVEFAAYGSRIIAYIIDVILLAIIVTLLSLVLVPILGSGTRSSDQLSRIGAAALSIYIGIVILVSLLYFPFFWQRSGQTPGMRVFGIRVVRDRDGGPVGWGSALLRYIGFFIDSIVFGLPIGWIWAFVDQRRRCWHDLIGSTVVVKA